MTKTDTTKDSIFESLSCDAIERALAYQFRDKSLLSMALTHRSALERDVLNTHGINNERLEYLGDAVLSLVTATYLYQNNNYFNEGELSRLRAQYVCQENLAQAARALDLGRFIKSDRSMRASGNNNSKATLADTVEAIIGAVFIDGGLTAAQAMIWQVLGVPPVKIVDTEKDAKTRLQEIIQAKLQNAPKYVVLEASGPPHAPTFVVAVMANDEVIATATGESKKIAAQNAAIAALAKFAAEKLGSP